MNLPRVIAHRGASRYAPENTMAAFMKAHEMGATWVETDVRLTKDHEPILLHDDSLLRTAGVNLLAHDLTYDHLHQQAPLIPRLQTLLTFLQKNNMGLNLELKPSLHKEVDTARVAMETLIEAGFDKEKLLISSFSMVALEAAYAVAPHYYYGWLSENDLNMALGLTSAIPFYTMNINKERANQTLIRSLTDRGYHVLCFTVNDKHQAEGLLRMGVTSVFSDEPNLL